MELDLGNCTQNFHKKKLNTDMSCMVVTINPVCDVRGRIILKVCIAQKIFQPLKADRLRHSKP